MELKNMCGRRGERAENRDQVHQVRSLLATPLSQQEVRLKVQSGCH